MNVLWLAAAPHPAKAGGHPVPWITALANGLTDKGNVKITMLSYNSYIAQDETFVHQGINYVFLKVPVEKWDVFSGFSGRIKRVQKYLKGRDDEFDLMHIHGAEQQYHVIGSALKIPRVLSAQGFTREYFRHLPKRPEYRHLSWLVAGYYEKRYMPTVKHFICRTHWDKSVVRRMQPRAVVHHNWELLRPEFYTAIRPSADEERNAVLFVGGDNYIKGIREALQTVDQLRKTIPVRLIVTGSGSKESILKLAAGLSLRNLTADAIEHRGMLPAAQLWDTYHEAFCLLHPSYIDNSPNSVCEAQLAGLPVVASDVGGLSSLIESGRTGLLTSLNVADIAQAVEQLRHNPSLRDSLAEQAREISLQRFDQQQIIGITESIYQQVLANP